MQYVPKTAGEYLVVVELNGVEIGTSPYPLTISPGEIAPQLCLTSISGTPIGLEAGITYFFTITLKDIFGNLKLSNDEGTLVEILANYVNHD